MIWCSDSLGGQRGGWIQTWAQGKKGRKYWRGRFQVQNKSFVLFVKLSLQRHLFISVNTRRKLTTGNNWKLRQERNKENRWGGKIDIHKSLWEAKSYWLITSKMNKNNICENHTAVLWTTIQLYFVSKVTWDDRRELNLMKKYQKERKKKFWYQASAQHLVWRINWLLIRDDKW